jgi:bile acid:Na+ symporter, BASS family
MRPTRPHAARGHSALVLATEERLMDIRAALPLLLQLSIFLVVMALGLSPRSAAPRHSKRRKGLIARSVLALNVVVPVLAIATVLLLRPARPVAIAIVLLSISPVPPFLPRTLLKLSRDDAYVYGILVVSSVLSIVFVPAVLMAFAALQGGRQLAVPLDTVLGVVFITVLLPLALGMTVRRAWPTLAARVEPVVSRIGGLLLLLVVIALFIGLWPAMMSLVGDGTILVVALVVALALASGHLLGGPEPENRVVLALSCAARHPGVALALATAAFPAERAVGAAVLLYLLVNAVYTIPYTAWWKRSQVHLPHGATRPLPH